MNIARLLVVTAAVSSFASLPLVAQSVNASAQQSASASAAGTHVNQSADANAGVNRSNAQAGGEAAGSVNSQSRHGSANADDGGRAAGNAQMRPVTGELESKLDSKTAKVGEPVVLKTTEKAKTADGVVIPRGTRLVGHVTEVEAHAKGHAQASMGIAFDRAELKNGQSFAIHSVIESVGPSAAQLEAQAMENQDAFASTAGGGAAAGGGAGISRSGGGLVEGGPGAVGGAGSAVGRVGSGVASTTGGALNGRDSVIEATDSLAANAAANAGRGVNGSAGAAGSLGAHATAIPGVMLNSNIAGGASGTFTAARQNIHFDSGTQMVLGVAAAK